MAIIWKVAALISLSWNLPNDELALKNELSRLESSWSSLDGWLNFWTLIVVIGVAVELVVIVVEYRHAMHDFERGIIRPPDRPNRWLLAFGLLGAGLVTIGVAGEFSVHVEAGRIETDMRDATGRLVGIANGRAGEANERASKNEKEAAQLRGDAAELEDSISWRRLTPKCQNALRGQLAGFSVKRTWFLYNVNDSEAFSFGTDLAGALNSAGWHPTIPEPMMKMTEGPVPFGTDVPETQGVIVSTTGEKANDDAANALIKSILALGFDCKKSSIPAVHEQHPAPAVFVFVESRPQGPQGDAKLRAEAKKKQQASAQTTSH